MFAPRDEAQPHPELHLQRRTSPVGATWSVTVRETLGREMRRMRERAGLSLLAAAKRTGITKPEVVRHENGQRGMTADTLVRYVRVYGGTLDELDAALARALGEEPTP